MLAMLEPAAGEQHRQVVVGVRVGAPHAGAVKHHRAVEQRLAFFLAAGERREEIAERPELPLLMPTQFGEHVVAVAVVRDVVDHRRGR